MTILELMVDANIDFLRRSGLYIDARTQEIRGVEQRFRGGRQIGKIEIAFEVGFEFGRVVKTDTRPVAEFVECGKAETGRETIRFDLEITVIRVRIAGLREIDN